MAEKKKMDPIKKIKLIYSGELILFSVIFLVLGILLVTQVICPSEWVRMVFNFLTIAGGIWMIVKLFWVIFSPAKRAKTSLFDTILMVPLGIGLIIFDIYCFVIWGTSGFPAAPTHCIAMGTAFIYIAAVYLAQAIYHYHHPIPGLLDEEEKKDEAIEGEFVEKNEEIPGDETGVEEVSSTAEEEEEKE